MVCICSPSHSVRTPQAQLRAQSGAGPLERRPQIRFPLQLERLVKRKLLCFRSGKWGAATVPTTERDVNFSNWGGAFMISEYAYFSARKRGQFIPLFTMSLWICEMEVFSELSVTDRWPLTLGRWSIPRKLDGCQGQDGSSKAHGSLKERKERIKLAFMQPAH